MAKLSDISLQGGFQYATPLTITDPEACFFYHRMEIPGVGEVGGQWDLRGCEREYLGNYSFTNKRVLDVGAASGFLTFTMERLGANVVSFDMASGDQWDIVPQKNVRENLEGTLEQLRKCHTQLKNSYWFAHKRLESQAKVFYGDIYNVPLELGGFDVAVFGMIMGHLRDPFQALFSVSRLPLKHIIITNQTPSSRRRLIDWLFRKRINNGNAYFMPTRENGESMAWWSLSEGCLEQMLAILGYRVVSTLTSNPLCLVPGRQRREKCIAIVAERFED